MNTKQKPMTISELGKLGAAARWAGKTDEQRKAAMLKVNKARKRSAKLARLAKEQKSA
jgi:hypothetical protein